jgi:DNA primase
VGIVDEDIKTVRDNVDIVALISEHVALKRVGRRFVGLCPFHAEKSGSFSVNAEDGVYYCFGCGAKGDAITFVRELEHLDFRSAVEILASKTGVELHYTDPEDDERTASLRAARDALAAATEFYRIQLHSSAGAPAREYLTSRGFTDDQVTAAELGWAPAGVSLTQALRRDEETLKAAGLLTAEKGNPYFHNRLMFPIHDVAGAVIGFGGRILTDGTGPKYLNSPDTPVYRKKRALYGLWWAKRDIVTEDEVVVLEGYTDVLAAKAAGITNCVATCGTALTDEHLRMLSRFAKNATLAFDGDNAGLDAAARLLAVPAGIDIRVAALPTGNDPADLAISDPDTLKAILAASEPLIGFRVNRLLDTSDLSTPESRARAAHAALGFVDQHHDVFVRDAYRRVIAERCDVDLRHTTPTAPPTSPAEETSEPDPTWPAVEYEAIRVLVAHPELGPFTPAALFTNPDCIAALDADNPDGATVRTRADADPRPLGTDPRRVLIRLAEMASRRLLTNPDADPTWRADAIRWVQCAVADANAGDIGAHHELLEWMGATDGQ